MSEFICLALLVYFEARDQDLKGQIAVAYVALNRTTDNRWPDSTCEVVFDGGESLHRCQFSFYCDGLSEQIRDASAWRRARTAATLVLANTVADPTSGATHYWSPRRASNKPFWIDRLEYKITLGDHDFYFEP